MSNETPQKFLVLDFDHTCYDTGALIVEGLKTPMINQFGISENIWEASYAETSKIGYTLEEHRQQMEKLLGYEPCSAETMSLFGDAIIFDKYLYPDVQEFLATARTTNYKIILLSFGDSNWQHRKVEGVHLEKELDVITYVTEHAIKGSVLDAQFDDTIIFVDDKASELDAFSETFPNAITYLINRAPSNKVLRDNRYLHTRYFAKRTVEAKTASPKHIRCTTLSDIRLV